MKKPKKTKPKTKRPPPQQRSLPQLQPTPPTNNRRTIGERIQNHPIVVSVSLAAAIVTLVPFAFEVLLRQPGVGPDPSVGETSYALPFTIRNQNDWLTMHAAQFRCRWNDITFQDAGRLVRVVFQGAPGQENVGLSEYEPSAPADIAPGGSVSFACDPSKYSDVRRVGTKKPLDLDNVKLTIEATYKTKIFNWFWSRSFTSEQFEWQRTAEGHKWLTGPLVWFNR